MPSLSRLSSIALLAIAVGFSCLVTPARANLHLEVVADVRRVIDLGVFAFNDNGFMSLHVHDLFISDPDLFVSQSGHVHDEPIGFVLDSTPSAQSARVEKNYAKSDGAEKRLCFINDPALKPDQRVSFPINGKKPSELRETAFETRITTPGLYALFFYNCKGFNDTSSAYVRPVPVSFQATALMYNIDAKGTKHYLSWAEQRYPAIYGVFTVIFGILTAVWVRQCRANPAYVHYVHHIMTFLLVVKTLSLLFEALKYQHFDTNGERSVWTTFYHIALTIKGITWFSSLLLLGSGWSILKSSLGENDKKILMVILPSQILINISLGMIEETSEGTKNWSSWYDLLQILDVVCCCCVLLPIVWSIKNLRDVAGQDDKAARTMGRMMKFRNFYIAIVAYIYFTRIVIVMIENSLPYLSVWMTRAGTELAAVVFYLYVGIKFQPIPENPYLEVDRNDAEEMESRKEVSSA